jgi:hypothetical protein
MANYNLGRVAFVDKGTYLSTVTYNKWDFVITSDSTYLYINDTPQAGTSLIDTNFWKCLADGKPSTMAAAAALDAKEQADTATINANKAADNANTKAGVADTATINANNAETLRANSESDRVNAENGRATAESGRVTAENGRATAESGRVTAENTRVSKENTRETNESNRQSNETTRQNNEGTRINQENSRVNAEAQRVASGSIIASQSNPQTLGSSSARLIKLWATDIDSSNMPTVAGVSLLTTLEQKSNKTSDIYTNRQSTTIYPTVKGIADYIDNFAIQTWVLSFRKTGDGTGITQINVTSNIDSVVTITNGYLYTDSAGNGQTTSINLIHNVATNIYFKAIQSNGFLTMKNIVTFNSSNPPANAPIFYFSVNSFPKTLTSFQWWYNNVGGGDIALLPSGLTTFNWGSSNVGTGDIANLPAGVTSFQWWGNNTGYGNFANFPAGLIFINWGGSNAGTGDIATIPAMITYLFLGGNNTGYGNMYNLPAGVTFVDLEGKNTVIFTDSSQSPRVWASGMRKVYLRPSAGVFTSAMTDALLISLSSQSSWTNEKTIDLRGNCGARTTASDSAVAILQGNGVTVLTN